MDKFDWQASDSAPEDYPMEIVSGHFFSPGGESLYIPNRKTLNYGWGNAWSSHIVGDDRKPLPNEMAITFFSYTENVFYRGRFELPYARILSLFQKGYYSPHSGEHITYNKMIAGVAPGGGVSVWLSGLDKITEVFFGRAKKEEVNWGVINDNPDYSREEYVRLEIEDTVSPESRAALKKNGIPFGLWEGYHRKRYPWQPVFTNVAVRDNLIYTLKYFNGEEDYLYVPLDTALAKQTRAVPSELHFVWERPEGEGLVLKLFFDEKEIFGLFDKLGGEGQAVYLEIRRIIVKKQEHFYFLLRNDKEEIYIRKTKVKQYAP